jgi:nucleoside-diphosphate-sugar epimerase
VQCVHADDVADAYARAVLGDVRGPVNVATEPVLEPRLVAERLGARTVPAPAWLLREGARLTWAARLQPSEPGWVTMGVHAPLMDCGRARTELGWKPTRDALSALQDLLDGMAAGAGAASPAMRPRDRPGTTVGRLLSGRPPGHGALY